MIDKQWRVVGWGGGKLNEADCTTLEEAQSKGREFIASGCTFAEIFERNAASEFDFVERVR